MTIEISEDLVIRGVAAAAEKLLMGEDLINRVADAIVARLDILTPDEAAALLEVTPRTLRDQGAAWGLDKSMAFGASNPRYFLSQILERARAKKLNGRASVKQPPTLKAVA